MSKSKKSEAEIEASDLDYFRETADPRDNEKTCPPEEERISIPALWAFEVYTPSYIANLHSGIKKHGWSENKWDSMSDFQYSLNNLRHRTSGSGWINIGYIIDIDQDSWWPSTKKAKLPRGIKAIKGSLIQFLPSTTIFVCQFIIDDELEYSIEIPLRDTYATFKEKISGGYIYHDVFHQKEEAVTLAREYLRNLCTSWLSQNFPGLFASGDYGNTFPACEFLLFKQYSPGNKKEGEFNKDYLHILGIRDDFDTWYCEELSGLFLQIKHENDSIVLFGNKNEMLSNKDLHGYGDEKKDQILNFLNYIDRTLGIWVVHCLSSTFEKHITKLRDSHGSIDIKKVSSMPSLLIELDTKILETQKNISPFLYELENFCSNKDFFMHDIYEFYPVYEMRKKYGDLFSSIRKNLIYLINNLSINEKLLQDTANYNRQIATIISSNEVAKTNIALQKKMNLMTLVILFLTMIASISGIIELQKEYDIYAIFKNVLSYIRSII